MCSTYEGRDQKLQPDFRVVEMYKHETLFSGIWSDSEGILLLVVIMKQQLEG